MRSSIIPGSAAIAAVLIGVLGLTVARAGPATESGQQQPAAETAVYRSRNTPQQDRLLAKAAFTEVLARKTETLGMQPPVNLPGYAPVFPDGLVLTEAQSTTSPTGGSLQYAAPGSLRTVLDFYEDAAALHRLPFKVAADGPDTLVLSAADGRRRVEARLTRQFANSTVVDLSYD